MEITNLVMDDLRFLLLEQAYFYWVILDTVSR